jgi:rhomboid protease GluP
MNQEPPSRHPAYPDEGDQSPPRWVTVQSPTIRPVVTYSILAVTIFIYVLQEISGFMLNGIDLPAAIGMKVNHLIIQGQYWRLITPVLLHGSIIHIGFNMYALFIFGPSLEKHMGHARYLTLYLLSAFAGNVISFIFTPANSLGSSTAIFGLIGAQAVFFYLNRSLFAGMARQALGQIAVIAAINFMIGLSPAIDNWGHLGGLIGGAIFTSLAGPLLSIEGFAPYLTLKDNRESRSVILGALTVALGFLVLAAWIIIDRTG